MGTHPLAFRRIALVAAALAVAAALFSGSAAAFTGTFVGRLDGQPVKSVLSERAGNVKGTVDISGYVYKLAARASGSRASGELQDEAGMRVPLAMELQDGRLMLAIYPQGQNGPAMEIALASTGKVARAPASSASAPKSGSAAKPRELDPALVGHWSKSESYTSGDFSAASETNIYLLPDGTYRYGASKLYGGGDAGSFGSEGAGGGEQGRWSTAGRILYVFDPASSQWSQFARYYVEGNRALLTYGNGKREVWQRRR